MFFSYPVSDDLQEWIEESFLWAIRHGHFRQDTPLVLADRRFFPTPPGTPLATAQGLVEDIKRICRIEDTALTVMELDALPSRYRHDYGKLGSTAGTWQAHDGEALICFDPALIERPVVMLSTLAHEVAHHVLYLTPEPPPGGAAAHELATDLAVIWLGMGVLQLAGADAAGWQGYLSQPTRAHALALFLAARGIDPAEAFAPLSRPVGKLLRRAILQVGRQAEVIVELREALRAVTA